MIDKSYPELSISKQCDLLEIHRSGLYYCPVPESSENLMLMRLIDEQYYKTPFYGLRKVMAWLKIFVGYECCGLNAAIPSLDEPTAPKSAKRYSALSDHFPSPPSLYSLPAPMVQPGTNRLMPRLS